MITVYTRAADGGITRPDGVPGRYGTADMTEAEALYFGLCARRDDAPIEAVIKYPGGTAIPDGRFRLDRDYTGPREQNSTRRAWHVDASPAEAPPHWLIAGACRYAKTEFGLVVREVADMVGQNDRTFRRYLSGPEKPDNRAMPIGIWWLLLIRLGLVPFAETRHQTYGANAHRK